MEAHGGSDRKDAGDGGHRMDEDGIERVGGALRWLRARLEQAAVPFQVVGGLAALAHGARRPLNDVDVYVPGGALGRLRHELAGHVRHGPHRIRDEHWDCYLMRLRHSGVDIELAEASRTRYRRGPEHAWHDAIVDFDRPQVREAFGVELPVMPRARLVAYKRRLGRRVDEEDLAALAGG